MEKPEWPYCYMCGGHHAPLRPDMCANPGVNGHRDGPLYRKPIPPTPKVELIEDSLLWPHWRRPRCQAQHSAMVHEVARLVRRPDLNQCKHGAIVKIDGVQMCKIHAGFKCLQHMLYVSAQRVNL